MILDRFLYSRKSNKKEDIPSEDNLESPVRSVVKSLSWRVIGTLDTIFISWIITGEVALAFSIGGIELISKMLLYFFHERIWNKIKWGR